MTIIVNGSNTPTAGAVGYGDGTNLAFTSAGTTGQFLSSNGSSAPSWVGAPASAMTLISTQTASSSATIAWTGLSGYDKYILMIENAFVSASANIIYMQVGTGAGPTYLTSGIGFSDYAFDNSIASFNITGQNSYPYAVLTNSGNVSSSYPISGQVNMQGFLATYWSFFSSLVFNNSTNNAIEMSNGKLATSNTITAIKLFLGSGNFVSGKFSLYGISS